MNPKNYITVQLNKEILATVIAVFDKMIDDPEAIDSSMYDLTEWNQFLALTEKFKTLLKDSDNPVVIPMTFVEWATYSSYSSHAFDLGDDLTPEEEAIMAEANNEIYKKLRTGSGES